MSSKEELIRGVSREMISNIFFGFPEETNNFLDEYIKNKEKRKDVKKLIKQKRVEMIEHIESYYKMLLEIVEQFGKEEENDEEEEKP